MEAVQEFKYKDLTFTLKADKLALYRDSAPLLRRYNSLKFKLNSEIDRTLILEYQKEISFKQANVTRATLKKKGLAEAQKELDALQEKFANDNKVKAINEYWIAEYEVALLELITDTEFMRDMIPKMLQEDTSAIDFGTIESMELISEIVKVFFFGSITNSNIST